MKQNNAKKKNAHEDIRVMKQNNFTITALDEYILIKFMINIHVSLVFFNKRTNISANICTAEIEGDNE